MPRAAKEIPYILARVKDTNMVTAIDMIGMIVEL